MMKTCNLVRSSVEASLCFSYAYLQCVPHIDPDVLTELVPQMVTILKSGVGLGTKVKDYVYM